MKKSFSIAVISRACGVQAHTLRAWESRYQMFSPERDENGKRIYSETDIHKAVLLASLVEHGYAISTLAKMTNAELQDLVDSLKVHDQSSQQNQLEVHSKRLLQFLENYDLENVSRELQYIRTNSSVRDFILKTVLPMMREIGIKVENKVYTVTQEHIMSTIVRDQLSVISIPPMHEKNSEIILATPEGNLHELSILIANILCRAHKFSTRYLGAAHPADCLAEAINTIKGDLLVLGTVSSDAWNYKNQIVSYLTQIDQLLKHPINIILGGGEKIKFPKFNHIHNVIVMPTFEEFDEYLQRLI